MKKLYILLLASFLITTITNISAQTTPCNLIGGSVYIDNNTNPAMMNATVNGINMYDYSWVDTNGLVISTANQTPFYTQWCVTIVDNQTGCDTTICQDCTAGTAVCMCTMIYMPVCGCDGVQYANSCLADCADVPWTPAVSNGLPGGWLPCTQPSSCVDSSLIDLTAICTLIWDPVCGCDSITYSNDCHALNFGGVTSWTQGACNFPTNFACIGGGAPGITTCVGPGNYALGQANVMAIYPTMAACISDSCGWNSPNPSWDCNFLTGACFDPMTGLGQYPTLAACQADSCGWNTAINEEISGLLIYPNPAKNTLTIDGNYISATIYNIFGKVVLTTDYQKTIDVVALSNGIYFMYINTNNAITVKKIIIAK